MNAMHGTMLSLAIAMGGWTSSAQQTTIPFAQIERDTQLSARLALPGNGTSSSLVPGLGPAEPSAAGVVGVLSVRVPRTLDSRFYLVNGLHLGMAAFDIGMTQHCMANHHCQEGNPLMPSSLAGQLSVNFALVGYSSFVSYKLKKHGSHVWWLSPAIGTGAHVAGAASGLAHQ